MTMLAPPPFEHPGAPDSPDAFDDVREWLLLAALLGTAYVGLLHATRAALVGAGILPPGTAPVDDALAQRALDLAAERAQLITETTRSGVAEAMAAADPIPALAALFGVTWASRAALIAATEAHHAVSQGAQALYRSAGLFDRQVIRDGRDHDADCRARDGRVVPLTETVAALHPRCSVYTRPLRRGERP